MGPRAAKGELPTRSRTGGGSLRLYLDGKEPFQVLEFGIQARRSMSSLSFSNCSTIRTSLSFCRRVFHVARAPPLTSIAGAQQAASRVDALGVLSRNGEFARVIAEEITVVCGQRMDDRLVRRRRFQPGELGLEHPV